MSVPSRPVQLEDSYARAVPALSLPWQAAPAREPHLLVLNRSLAADLGLSPDWLAGDDGVQFLLGHRPAGVATVAQAYAGHQFGGYSPLLGDGRALLVGELVDPAGARHDLHLKGSGRTPFARRGDGKAAVGPMLREYLVSEAMHALGIPSTRSLAVVATGEGVQREQVLPGAVLARVAASHLRVGTFQYAAALSQHAAHQNAQPNAQPNAQQCADQPGPEPDDRADTLRALADYAITRHYPHLPGDSGDGARYLAFFEQVVQAQAELIAAWMSVGFVHGVMNTDNMTISGETIDYGPCAFLDGYDEAAVFSSIDHDGRYAYGNQPRLAQWNLARLAETLLPLIAAEPEQAVEAATAVLVSFTERYETALTRRFSAKLVLSEENSEFVRETLELLQAHSAQAGGRGIDFTSFFRGLADGTAGDLFEHRMLYDAWAGRWQELTGEQGEGRAAALRAANPLYVPRNHVLEQALAEASAGDLTLFDRLLGAVREPFTERAGLDDLTGPAPDSLPPHVTYCGT